MRIITIAAFNKHVLEKAEIISFNQSKTQRSSFSYKMRLFVGKPAFLHMRKQRQISFAVTVKLISAFVFATWIEQFLYFLNPKFQASSHLLCLHSPVRVGPGRKPPKQVFSERASYYKCRNVKELLSHATWK